VCERRRAVDRQRQPLLGEDRQHVADELVVDGVDEDLGLHPVPDGGHAAIADKGLALGDVLVLDDPQAHAAGIKIGICGQAPSNYPEFAGFLVEHGIDSISLNPDSFVAATRIVAQTEKRLASAAAKAA